MSGKKKNSNSKSYIVGAPGCDFLLKYQGDTDLWNTTSTPGTFLEQKTITVPPGGSVKIVATACLEKNSELDDTLRKNGVKFIVCGQTDKNGKPTNLLSDIIKLK